jgi:hypothetical protein
MKLSSLATNQKSLASCKLASKILEGWYEQIRYAQLNEKLGSMTGKALKNGVLNDWVKKECKLKEDVKVKIQKNVMRWFGHVERIDDERLTKSIYKGNVRKKRERGRPKKE